MYVRERERKRERKKEREGGRREREVRSKLGTATGNFFFKEGWREIWVRLA